MANASSSNKQTPLMRQHGNIKSHYPDAILLFRVGDFYETFGQDAIDVSKILHIALTKRNSNLEGSVALAGFPHHALDTYLHKIIQAGRRVAICDQLEDPQKAKGLVKRGVTEIVTPGVTVNDKILNAVDNNYLASIHIDGDCFGISFVDISTATFYVAEGDIIFVQKLLQSFSPSEIILAKQYLAFFNEHISANYYTYTLEDWIFDYTFNKENIIQHFQIHHSLKGFGLEEMQLGTIAAGVILHYLKEIKHPNIAHLQQIQKIHRDDHMWMDQFTIRNLEIITGQYPLINVIDGTASPMGARLLKRWVMMPLVQKDAIEERLSLTDFFIQHSDTHQQIKAYIKGAGDIERLIGKVPPRKVNPREVMHISTGLKLFQQIKEFSITQDNAYLKKIATQINDQHILSNYIETTLVEEPPIQIGKSELILAGVHEELDNLRKLLGSNKEGILKIQQEAINATGINGLRLGFNQVFGYYLEVSNTHKDKVPPEWIRKQTLTNAERYITQGLKEYEEKVLGAQDKILAIEQELYERILQQLQEALPLIIHNCHMVAIIDCLQGFAHVAIKNKYVKPEITDGEEISLFNSRHPVIEQHFTNSNAVYIPNDIKIDKAQQQILIITGPNMSGKSAILRQTALNILMSHIGSFVACSKAHIPITDKIFTRVGANDNLAQGESTFMVEMNETASILNNISSSSLILLDEIGRGTSTYDGISIAWSILEYLAQHTAKPKVLFSTHYHEIVSIENSFENVKNFHVSNKEENNKIIFLRKLKRGGSMHSFGIHVAKMAGLPNLLIERAYQLLQMLENREKDSQNNNKLDIVQTLQTVLPFNNQHPHQEQTDNKLMTQLKEQLAEIDIERITPVEALMKLQELKMYVNRL